MITSTSMLHIKCCISSIAYRVLHIKCCIYHISRIAYITQACVMSRVETCSRLRRDIHGLYMIMSVTYTVRIIWTYNCTYNLNFTLRVFRNVSYTIWICMQIETHGVVDIRLAEEGFVSDSLQLIDAFRCVACVPMSPGRWRCICQSMDKINGWDRW